MKTVLKYVLMFLVVQAVTSGVVQGVMTLVADDKTTSLMTLVVASLVSDVLLLWVFLRRRWAEVSPAWLLTRPWSVLLWAVAACVGLVIPELWVVEKMPQLPDFMKNEFGQMLDSYWGYVVIGVIAPIVEEVVFRGAVLRSLLDNYKPWTAIAISALLFSVVHMNPAQMPAAFLIGLLLGWMYWRTRSILPGVVYHFTNNSIAYVMSRLYPGSDVKLVDLFGDETHVLMAVGCSLLILLPSLFQLHQRMRRADQ